MKNLKFPQQAYLTNKNGMIVKSHVSRNFHHPSIRICRAAYVCCP